MSKGLLWQPFCLLALSYISELGKFLLMFIWDTQIMQLMGQNVHQGPLNKMTC